MPRMPIAPNSKCSSTSSAAQSRYSTNENLTCVRCRSENGPLKPSSGKSDRPECKNIIDPTTLSKLLGQWVLRGQMSEMTILAIKICILLRAVDLLRGSAEAEPVLAVHGFMMSVAWGILLPAGILSARYLKHVKGDGWYRIHVYLQYSGLAIVLLALLFAVAELRGFFFGSIHVKFGTTALLFLCMQPVNAFLRPKKPNNGEEISSKTVMWEYLHVIGGRCAVVVGIGALFTGMNHLGDRNGGENVHGLNWPLIVWFLMCALIVLYLEYRQRQRRRDRSLSRSNWVLGNLEEDDSVDLLSPNGTRAEKESHTSGRMEVQLEPLNR